MSGRLVGEVLANRARLQLTDAEFAILVSLAEDARDDRIARTRTANKVLAEHAGRSLGTTRNVISGLVRRGYLEIEKPAGPRSATYYLVPDLTQVRVIPRDDTKRPTNGHPHPVDNPQSALWITTPNDESNEIERVTPGNAQRVTPGNDADPYP